MTSYRQMIKERPGELEVLTRFFALAPASQFDVLTTCFAKLLLRTRVEKQKELLAAVQHMALKKYVSVSEKGDPVNIEICVVCENPFASDGSNEVPVCMPCLTGVRKEASV